MSLFTRIWNALDNFASIIASLTQAIAQLDSKLRESVLDGKPVEMASPPAESLEERQLVEEVGANGKRRLKMKV